MNRLGRLFRRLARDRRGVSAVEFALIGPIMIACYFALAELSGAMMAERKASHVCSAVGDLVAQVSTINDAGLADVFAAASTIMKPMALSPLSIRVTSVSADATGKTTVVWSKIYGTGLSALPAGQTVTVPAGLLAANETIIMSEAAYPYTSPVSQMIPHGINFTEIFYLRPRTSDQVTWGP